MRQTKDIFIMDTIISLEKLYLFLGIFLAVCILVISAIMLDLWDGVHTAKKPISASTRINSA